MLTPVIDRILKDISDDTTHESLSLILPIKTALVRFDSRLKEIVNVLDEVLSRNDYLNEMYISFYVSTGMKREGLSIRLAYLTPLTLLTIWFVQATITLNLR